MKTFKELETKSALDLMEWLRDETKRSLKNSNGFLEKMDSLSSKTETVQRSQLLRFSTFELMKVELFEQNLRELRKDVESQTFNY